MTVAWGTVEGTASRAGLANRAGVAVAGLAGVLVLGGCGGGGSGGSDGPGGGASESSASATAASPTAASSAGASSAGASSAGAGELEGSWLTTAGGKAVALLVTGDRAGLFATGGTVCSGSADTVDGTRHIRLTCTDGNKDRVSGTVESVDGSSLKVDWSGGVGTETYVKAEGGKLPSGLPTAGAGD